MAERRAKELEALASSEKEEENAEQSEN